MTDPASQPPPPPPHHLPPSGETSIPRCPRCAFALTALGASGRCPECGETYTETTRFSYLTEGGFGRSIFKFLWPLGLLPFLYLLIYFEEGPEVVVIPLLCCGVLLVNSCIVAYGILRRRRLRRLDAQHSHVRTTGLVLQSLGCGMLAAATIALTAFAVSCGAIIFWATAWH